jgi:GMP synthase (glutamine-hydrolysing)
MKLAMAIRHVAFEDLGSFEGVLRKRGFTVRYHDIGLDELAAIDPLAMELLIVLGGPIGVYEDERYPFLKEELRLLETRLTANRPTLGICLGCQLMAKALGARVYPGPHKEIGFAPIMLTAAGQSSCLAPFSSPGATVLHWHGDTFDLPSAAVRLASTEHYENQAFAVGGNLIGLQFHPEATASGFERWLIGHTAELTSAGISVTALRAAAERQGPAIAQNGAACLGQWLDGLDIRSS